MSGDDDAAPLLCVSPRGTIRLDPSAPSREQFAVMLESVAADLRTGRVDCVAVACVLRDGAIGTAFGQADGYERPFVLLGAIEVLKARLLSEVV